jgi:hypothetical protein
VGVGAPFLSLHPAICSLLTMVRDSTHRPRNTDELLSLAVEVTSQPIVSPAPKKDRFGNLKCDDSALISFLSTRTDCGQEEDSSDDGDTIVQLKGQHSLDEEIQSTIDELQRNSLTLREVESTSEDCITCFFDNKELPPLSSTSSSQVDSQGDYALADSSTSASVSVILLCA